MWKAASDKEMKSLQDLKVYTLVPRSEVPPGQKVIGSKWAYKVKVDNTHKARLVAKGWSQVPGRDCGGTFAPVCRLQSIRMVLVIAAEMNWEVVQLDVKTAFLYADIEENVFVEMAPGYETTNRKNGVQLVGDARPQTGYADHHPGKIHQVCSRQVQHGELQSSLHPRLRLRAIGGAVGGDAPQRRGQAALPGYHRFRNVLGSDHPPQHHAQHQSARSGHVDPCEDSHGSGEAPSSLYFWDEGFQHRVQERRSKTHSILRLQLGQQSGQRKIHVTVHHDAGKGASELEDGASKPHCHIYQEGRARCCGTGDEGGNILHQHDYGAGIQI